MSILYAILFKHILKKFIKNSHFVLKSNLNYLLTHSHNLDIYKMQIFKHYLFLSSL